MLQRIITAWIGGQDPERLRSAVYLGQALLGACFIGGFFWLRKRDSSPGFRVRDSEPRGKAAVRGFTAKHDNELAQARMKPRPGPLLLSGISIEGKAHEVLGVDALASEAEIQRAYRDLMKRYHPDVVARPGTRQWNDAQQIAEALNRAKQEMLDRLKTGRKPAS